MEALLQKHQGQLSARRLGSCNRCVSNMSGKHTYSWIKFYSFIVVVAGFFLTEFNVRQTLKKNTQVNDSITVVSPSNSGKIHLRRPDYNITRREPNSTSLEDVDEQMSDIERISRAFPLWINDRLTIDSNSRPYDWCVPNDLISENTDSPKGLFFIKLPKSGSSTGAAVTGRIRDGLSRRLTNNNSTSPSNCFTHYVHATAGELKLQNRDPMRSFLWSIVREPAQRTLSYFFYRLVSQANVTATEDGIMAVLKKEKPYDDGRNDHNFQSQYLDLPHQTELQDKNSSITTSAVDRIINGYDFLAVNERMDESLVVLAMLAQIPLADVVVFSSKVSGGYATHGKEFKGYIGCMKVTKKWTTPKIDEYIAGDYRIANKDDYLLYNAAQRSLDKTIDALGRQRVKENVKLLKSLQQQNEEQCASKVTIRCPEPEDPEMKRKHKRLAEESCFYNDVGCGHACTDEVLSDYAEREWARILTSGP